MTETRNIDIAEVLRDARLGDLRTLAEEPVGYDELHRTTNGLFDLLDARGVEYVLVGGLAVLQYLPGRNTRDIDLIMSPSDLDRLPELELLSRDNDFGRAMFRGVQLDLLLTSNPVFELVRASHSAAQPFADRDIRCATPEGLVLMKLFALPSLYRQGDFGRVLAAEGDLDRLIYEAVVDADTVLVEASQALGAALQACRQYLDESRGRIQRFEERRAAFPAAAPIP